MKVIASVIAVALLVCALAACNGPYRARTLSNSVLQNEKIVLVDAKVARYLRFVREFPPGRLSGGELEVGAVFVNVKGKKLRCDVKVVFLDENGIEIDATSWEPIIYEKMTEVPVKRNSLNPEAVDYRFYIRLQQ